MLRMILLCEKCEKETAGYEESQSYLFVDFKKKELQFDCPLCNHRNVMKMINSKIQKLPGLGGAKF